MVLDKLLVSQALGGDAAAYAQLVGKYRSSLHAHIYSLLQNASDVEDIVQDAFERAWRSLGSYNESYAFSTWLYRIATNTCLDHMRKRRPELTIDAPAVAGTADSYEVHLTVGQTPESSYIRKQREQLMRRSIRRLNTKQQLLLEMYYFEEMSCAAIAEELGITANNVRQQLHQSRAALLRHLQSPEARDYIDQSEYRRRSSQAYTQRLRRS